MNEFDIFVNNFKNLRYSHKLSSADLVYLLSLKSRSSVTNLESKRALPSFEFLVNVSKLFAVKIDWLIGRSSYPYDEEMILRFETELMNTKLNADTEFKQSVPNIYYDIEKRAKFYSLQERANLVFLLQYLKILTKKEAALLNNNNSPNFFEYLLKQANIKKQRFKDAEQKYLYLLRCIATILLNDVRMPLDDTSDVPFVIPEPLFDITKNPENL